MDFRETTSIEHWRWIMVVALTAEVGGTIQNDYFELL